MSFLKIIYSLSLLHEKLKNSVTSQLMMNCYAIAVPLSSHCNRYIFLNGEYTPRCSKKLYENGGVTFSRIKNDSLHCYTYIKDAVHIFQIRQKFLQF